MPSTEHFLSGVRQVVDEAERKWRSLATTLAQQYEIAFNTQQGILNGIKKDIEAKKKADQERQALALSIVTAGLLGPFSKVLSSPIDDVIKQVPQGTSKYLLEMLSNTAGKINEKAIDKISSLGASEGDLPQSTIDGFSPSGMSPLAYWVSLEDNIGQRFLRLAEAANVLWKSYSGVSPATAEVIYNSFEKSCYGNIRELGDIKSSKFKNLMKTQAEAALWVAWLRGRDLEYWKKQNRASQIPIGESESWQWSALVDVFRRLSMPIVTRKAVVPGVAIRMTEIVDMPQAITFARTPVAYQFVAAPLIRLTRGTNPGLVTAMSSITIL